MDSRRKELLNTVGWQFKDYVETQLAEDFIDAVVDEISILKDDAAKLAKACELYREAAESAREGQEFAKKSDGRDVWNKVSEKSYSEAYSLYKEAMEG